MTDTAAAQAPALTGEYLPAGPLPKSEVAEYDSIAAGLAELRSEAALQNFDLTTTAGDKAARSIRARHVELRSRVEDLRVRAKQPHLDRGREIDAAAKFLTAEILRSEEPLDKAILAKQREKEAEKARREEADRAAKAAIGQRIDWIRGRLLAMAGKPSADVDAEVGTLEQVPITAELYGERLTEAAQVKGETLAELRALSARLKPQEQEAARLAEERRVFAEQQAEAKRRADAEDAERRERIRREDAERAEQQRREDEQRAAARKAEDDRIAAAKAEQDRKDAAERAERERREQEAADERRRRRAALEELADPWKAIGVAMTLIVEGIEGRSIPKVAAAFDLLERTTKAREELAALDKVPGA